MNNIPDTPKSDQKSSDKKFLSKNKNIFIILLVLLIIALAGISSYTQFFPPKTKTQIILPTPPIPVSRPVVNYKPSLNISTQSGTTFFAGEVMDKGETFISIKGAAQTLKFTIPSKTYVFFIEIPKISTKSINDLKNQKPTIVEFVNIKKGDFVSLTLKTDNHQVTTGGLIFK